MSKPAMTPEEALALYVDHVERIKQFHANRRAYDRLQWHKALFRSRYKSGTNERFENACEMRKAITRLKKWHAGDPDVSTMADLNVRAAAQVLAQHVRATVEMQDKHDELYGSPAYYFENDWWPEDSEELAPMDQSLRRSYELLEVWREGGDVLMHKLAA